MRILDHISKKVLRKKMERFITQFTMAFARKPDLSKTYLSYYQTFVS